MGSFDIGAKLRQERVSQGLTIADIANETRIAPRFLNVIEAGDFAQLPSLIFTRNFVKQYAISLKLDPDPLLAELPKHDEATVQLPEPPARSRSSSYHRDRALRSMGTSAAWVLLAGGAGFAAYVHFNHTLRNEARPASAVTEPRPLSARSGSGVQGNQEAASPLADAAPLAPPQSRASGDASKPIVQSPPAQADSSAPVQVSMTAHQAAWVQITADGKPAFTGTLQSNETKQVAALEQVKIVTGNAGGLSISLNGKMLDPLGPAGQIRSVKLTAEGPQPLARVPQPVYDPL